MAKIKKIRMPNNSTYDINDTRIPGIDTEVTTGSSNVVTSGAVASAIEDIGVPTKVSDLTNDAGYTTNIGTITGITMNGVSKGTSGVVDLGTVITSDEKVKQSPSTDNSAFEVLLSGTADNTERTETTKKSSTLKYNPSTKALVTGGTVDGYTLNAAAGKAVDSSIAAGSTSTNLPTSAAVAGYVDDIASDKQDTLVSGTNIKTINNQSLLGSGDITITDGTVSTTWSELKTLRDGGDLIPGTQYRITDYVATTTYVESRSANHPFDIIILALDENHLSEEGYAILHEGDTYFANNNLSAWKVWYTIDNDVTRFTWADSVNGKGVIYRLIDEFNNDLPYDFKGIQFKRYKVTTKSEYSNELSDLNDLYVGIQNTMIGLDKDDNDFNWYYTFTKLDTDWATPIDASLTKISTCHTQIGNMRTVDSYNIPNNVFLSGSIIETYIKSKQSDSRIDSTTCSYHNKFDDVFDNNTIVGSFAYCESSLFFRNNTILGVFRHNKFNQEFQNNSLVFLKDCSFNTFADIFDSNVCKITNIYDNEFYIYFRENKINSSNIIQNKFCGNFSNNIVNGQIRNCQFLGYQIKYNQFLGILITCTISSVTDYCIIPANGNLNFCHVDIKSIRGTSSNPIILDYTDFYRTSLSGVHRRITIEGSTNGDVVAT